MEKYKFMIDDNTNEVYDIISIDDSDYIKLPGILKSSFHKILDYYPLNEIINLSEYQEYGFITALKFNNPGIQIIINTCEVSIHDLCNHGKVKLSLHEYERISDLLNIVNQYKEGLKNNPFLDYHLNFITMLISDLKYPCYTCYTEY